MQGKVISGYTLKKLLGYGGMAEVWYAENNIGKTAAVKLLLSRLCEDQNVMSRFRTEAMVMVSLSHPNIRQVYDYGEIDGRPAIVMEYLEGDDLKARLKRGQRFSEADLENWWNQLADALNYTHQKGIVHRDIKPGNIFVDKDGNVKLLDFGIAKVRESMSSTQTGQKLGTLMYMSPEQVRDSKHIDYHTDVYSLAVTFVNLLTGKKPYDTETSSDFDISEQIVYKPLDLSGVPEKWAAFLAPYLEKDPQKRPELRHFFEAIALDDDDTTEMGGVQQPQPQPKSKLKPDVEKQPQKKTKKALWIVMAIIAVVGALVLGLTLGGKMHETKLADSNDTIPVLIENPIDNSGNLSVEVDPQLSSGGAINPDDLRQQEEEAQRRREDDMYGKCNTVSGCDAYLREFPSGRYVDKVRQKRAELIEDEAYGKCTTIAGCHAYLMKYPNGRYAAKVQRKLDQLQSNTGRPSTTTSTNNPDSGQGPKTDEGGGSQTTPNQQSNNNVQNAIQQGQQNAGSTPLPGINHPGANVDQPTQPAGL